MSISQFTTASSAVAKRSVLRRPVTHLNAVPAGTDHSFKEVHKVVTAVSCGSLETNDAVEHIVDICRGAQQATLDTPSTPTIIDARDMHARQLASALEELSTSQHTAAAINVEPSMFSAVRQLMTGTTYHAGAQMLMFECAEPGPPTARLPGTLAIVSSGPQDNHSSDACKLTASLMGCYAFTVQGISTGSISSLLDASQRLQAADVLIVCAGADPALPGVLAGIVEVPVIALPGVTSAAYSVDTMRVAVGGAVPGVVTVGPGDGVAAAAAAARTLRCAKRYMDHRDAQSLQGVRGLAGRDGTEHAAEGHTGNNIAPAQGIFAGAGSEVPEQQKMRKDLHEAMEMTQ